MEIKVTKVDEAVGAKIKLLRLSRGYSAEELAEEVGVPADEYPLYERGEKRFSAEILLKLCQILETTSAEVFSNITSED